MANPILHTPHKRSRIAIFCASLSIIICFGFAAALPDFRTSIPWLALITGMITILIALIHHITLTTENHLSPWMILGIAAAVRIMFVCRPPELSDDIYRYIWDGLRTIKGINPYAMAPAAVQPHTQEGAHLLSLVNHADLVTIYPPGAQLVFSVAAALGGSAFIFKSFLALMDLASCAVILSLLKRFGKPSVHAILYAWHPLPILEIAGSGHIDGAGIFFLLMAFYMAESRWSRLGKSTKRWRPCPFFISGFFYAWSCLVKLFPGVFFPILLNWIPPKNRHHFFSGALMGGVLLCLPFLNHIDHMLSTLLHYTRHWEFSGFSFFWLRQLSVSGMAARYILSTIFLTILFTIWTRVWRQNTAQPHHHTHRAMMAIYGINLSFLFLTPTLHPWYALYLTAILPFVPRVTGLILSWSVLLAYAVLIPYALTRTWTENPLATILIWLGPLSSVLITGIIRRWHRYGNREDVTRPPPAAGV